MSSTPTSAALDRRDLAAVLVLAVASIALRAAWLDWPAFNPDEGICAARATFYISSGTTPFTRTSSIEHTCELFRLMTMAFGSYPMTAIRGVVLAIAIAMAAGVYWVVRGLAARWAALIAGLMFVYYNLHFEGLSANREWFSGGWSWLSVCLFLLSSQQARRRRLALVTAAGVAAGMGVWFKEQAALLVLPVPTLLVYEALVARRWREPLAELSAYVAGGAVAAALYLAPYLAMGTLDNHLYFLTEFRGRYVGAYRDVVPRAPEWLVLWHALFQDLPWRQLPLLAYVSAGAVAAAMIRCLVGGAAAFAAQRSPQRDAAYGAPQPTACDTPAGDCSTREARTAPLMLLYMLAVLAALRVGGKFYAHYYVYVIPPWAVLVGLGAWMLWHPVRVTTSFTRQHWLTGAMLIALVLDATLVPPPILFESVDYDGHLPAFADGAPVLPTASVAARLAAAAGVAIVVLLSAARWWPPTRGNPLRAALPALATVWLVALVAGLAVQTSRNTRAAARIDDEPPVPALIAYFDQAARPQDRLLVWGFFTELYVYTRLEAASEFVEGVLILTDVMRAGPAQVDERYAAMLMDDLAARRPRWIVDAAQQSVNPELYRIENFPALVELLSAEYELVAQLDGCRVWVRRDDLPPHSLIDPPDPTTSKSTNLDRTPRNRPAPVGPYGAASHACSVFQLVAPTARAGYDSGFDRRL